MEQANKQQQAHTFQQMLAKASSRAASEQQQKKALER